MRSIATCYNEHAIRVSDSYCSGPSSNHVLSYRSPALSRRPSLCLGPAEIVSTYRAKLPSGKQLLISLAWRNTFLRQGLIIDFSTSGEFPAGASTPRQVGKTKGRKSFEVSDNTKVDVSWDLSFAQYDGGPEPLSGFYVAVQVDSEIILLLGDGYDDSEDDGAKAASNVDSELISRCEQFLGGTTTTYSTRARFGGMAARDHNVLIKCGRDEEEEEEYDGRAASSSLTLSVFVDGKKMIRVRRLRWNFRGNQSIFVDGLLVDMMWDVHGWFFGRRDGHAVFMLRTRRGLDSRLWLEEKKLQGNEMMEKKKKVAEFSLLLICPCNSNSSPP